MFFHYLIWQVFLFIIATFPVDKRNNLFLDLDLTSGLPNLWQASMPFSSIFTFMSEIMKITAFSKSLSSMESGILLITVLIFLLYWVRKFWSISSLSFFTSGLLHFCRKFWFSPWRRLITLSPKLFISFLRLELPLLIASLRLSLIFYCDLVESSRVITTVSAIFYLVLYSCFISYRGKFELK